jgi:RNA polymerase primary sigma factor
MALKKRDAHYMYLNEISKVPLLTKNEEKLLLKKAANGDRTAFNSLIEANLRFVVQVANHYRGLGLDIGDLINEGNLGLMEAAIRFDLSQKTKFISYAVFWIRQNIVKALNEKARLIRISAEKELMLRRFKKIGGATTQAVGGMQFIDAKSLEGCSRYKAPEIEKILQMDTKPSSLDAPVDEEGETRIIDTIADSAENASEVFMRESKNALLREQLAEYLDPKELKVINLIYGLESGDKNDLKEIAQITGLTKREVCLCRDSAMEKLRAAKDSFNYNGF